MSDATDVAKAIQEYVDEYEMDDGESIHYTPNEHEKTLILDAMMGFENPRIADLERQLAQAQDKIKRLEASGIESLKYDLAEALKHLSDLLDLYDCNIAWGKAKHEAQQWLDAAIGRSATTSPPPAPAPEPQSVEQQQDRPDQ